MSHLHIIFSVDGMHPGFVLHGWATAPSLVSCSLFLSAQSLAECSEFC